MDMIDPAVDLMEFIALLAGVCSICFIVIIPLTKKINEIAYYQKFDKTVSSLKGEKPTVKEDGCLSAQETAAMIASQSPYLVSPISTPNIEDMYVYQYCKDELNKMTEEQRKIKLKLGTETITLTGLAQYSPETASVMLDKIKQWCVNNGKDVNTTRFKVLFSMGTSSTPEDNVYQLYYLDTNGNYVKCD